MNEKKFNFFTCRSVKDMKNFTIWLRWEEKIVLTVMKIPQIELNESRVGGSELKFFFFHENYQFFPRWILWNLGSSRHEARGGRGKPKFFFFHENRQFFLALNSPRFQIKQKWGDEGKAANMNSPSSANIVKLFPRWFTLNLIITPRKRNCGANLHTSSNLRLRVKPCGNFHN